MVEVVGLPMRKKYNYDVKTAFYTPLVFLSCTRVAASRMQIVPEWTPVACKLYPRVRQLNANFSQFYSCCMQLTAKQIQFSFDWQPVGYNLYATGRRSHANFACASGQLRAKPPVFCKHAVRTII
jgi:hypothetical protein